MSAGYHWSEAVCFTAGGAAACAAEGAGPRVRGRVGGVWCVCGV